MIDSADIPGFTNEALLQLRDDWRHWDESLDPENELDEAGKAEILAAIELEIAQRGL